MTRHLIISTCGTSLLTNGATPDLRAWLTERANARGDDLSAEDEERIRKQLARNVAELDHADLKGARRLTAELNGIVGFYDEQLRTRSQDQQILLHTDTFQGHVVAEALRDWIAKRGLNASCQCAVGLTTRTIDAFRTGISSVITWCEQTLPGYRNSEFRIVMNLVGGFKALQGYMQTLGMFYADEMIYIFENNELLSIPRLPVELDRSVENAVRHHIGLFRRLANSDPTLRAQDTAEIPETFIYKVDSEVDFSPWGRLVWERLRQGLYGEQIWALWSPLVRLSDRAARTAADLSEDQRRTFNERMDDLSSYLASNRQGAINRLDFKVLKGDPSPPSSHEFDLWADRGAWRGFGHFEDATFVVDTLGPGLH